MPIPGFPTTMKIQVRFRDTDAMGHVNNAVYLSYLELARMEYIQRVFGITRYGDVDFILARVEIDYRSPGVVGDDLEIGTRVSRLGGASFTMDYIISEAGTGRLVAEAKTVQVSYDYNGKKVKKLSEEFIRKVKEHDKIA